MAIDTRQKRFSIMNFSRAGPHVALFEADGTVDADDREHLLHLYSGIALASPAGQTFFSRYYYDMLLAREGVQ
jgi:hypothetical protein